MINNNQEMVNHPSHYKTENPEYEPYKVIAKWGCNFNIGNAIKYLARYKAKWNPIEDLKKAKQYIDFEIEELEKCASAAAPEVARPVKEVAERKSPMAQKPRDQHGFDGGRDPIWGPNRDCETDCGCTTSGYDLGRTERMLNRAKRALADGESPEHVMKNILGMSDSEIDSVLASPNNIDAISTILRHCNGGFGIAR